MKLIILDRDGVINVDSDAFIKNVDEWIPIPNSIEAIAKLSQAGYKIAIATNQSGIGRGLFSIQALDDIHQLLQKQVQAAGGHIDAIFFCPHTSSDHCHCRKPDTGLFELIAAFFQTSLKGVVAIGDAARDMEAAVKMECRPVLVLTGKGEKTRQLESYKNEVVYKDLHEAVSHII